jgi:hypothetical protein
VVQQSGGAVQRSPLQPYQLQQQHPPTETHTASFIDQVISRTGDKTVLQRFWMREPTDQEPHWEAPQYMLSTALKKSTYQVKVSYGKPNKRGNRKTRTETRDEMKKDYPLLGPSSQVYKKRADVKISWVNLMQMVDAIGIEKVEAILNGHQHWKDNRETPLLLKHLDSFRQMELNVVTTLMSQHYTLTARFLQDLSPQEMKTYFSNTPAQQLGQVTGAEFASFVHMVHKEKEMPQTEMLPLSPTTGQGAHHVSEHGAQSTTQQTIERAVAYAYKRGNNHATKGNWVSHEVADAAMNWAQTRVNLWVQQADADNTRTVGVLNSVPAPNGIFGTNAFRNNVRAVISQGEYEHGNVSGKRGAATAAVTGDFTDLGGTVQQGAITGNFMGSFTQDIARPVIPRLIIDFLTFRGNGAVNADINARTVAGGQLNGRIVGQTTFNNGHVNIQAGNTDFFDGTGNFQTPMDDNINAGNTNWNDSPSKVGGYVEARTGNQQVSVNPTGTGRLTSKLYRAGYWTNNIGMVFQRNEQGYSNGVTNLSNANPKVSNLQVTLANTDPGGRQVFRPRTLQDIVRNATITAKQEHYVKTSVGGAAPPSIDAPLLKDSVMVQGTIADLQAANLVPPPLANLTSMRLQVNNVQKVTTSAAPDIRTAGPAPALAHYQTTLNGELLEFDLHSFSAPAAPVVNNFQVLMKLKNEDHATYLPFTAY